MSNDKLEGYFFTTLFIGTLIVVGILFYPYIGALAVALVLAALVHPLYVRLRAVVCNDTGAALATVLLALVLILVPGTFLGYLIVEEVRTISTVSSLPGGITIEDRLRPVQDKLNEVLPRQFNVDVNGLLSAVGTWISRNMGGALESTASVVIRLFVMIIALYYFIKDGALYRKLLVRYSPLSDDEDIEILRKLDLVTHSLIRGRLVIALIQGLLTAIGFILFGLPSPVLWGSVAAVTAIIPTFGTGIVTVPAFLFLILSGQYVAATLFATWGVLVIGMIDNLLGPRLIGYGKGVEIHPLLVLLAVLGGLSVFGAAGFLIGPLLLAFCIALSHIYLQKITTSKAT